MQLFLIGFIIISICEIFTIGWFPLNGVVRRVSLHRQRNVTTHTESLIGHTGILRCTHWRSRRYVLDSVDEWCRRISSR